MARVITDDAEWERWCAEREVYDECHRRPRCEARTPACTGRNEHAHHRKMRSQGGPTTRENLLAVCEPCHRYIHGHPAESYERGWLIRSTSPIGAYQDIG